MRIRLRPTDRPHDRGPRGPTALLTIAGRWLLTDPTFDDPGEYPGRMFTLVKTALPTRSAADVGIVVVVLLARRTRRQPRSGGGYLHAVPLVLSTAGAVERLGGTTDQPSSTGKPRRAGSGRQARSCDLGPGPARPRVGNGVQRRGHRLCCLRRWAPDRLRQRRQLLARRSPPGGAAVRARRRGSVVRGSRRGTSPRGRDRHDWGRRS